MRRRAVVMAAGGVLGIAALAAAVVAPALAQDDGQPPAGDVVETTTDFVPGDQPPPGEVAAKVTDFVLGDQPPNPNPQLELPREQSVPQFHGELDEGVPDLAPTADLGDPAVNGSVGEPAAGG